MKKVLLVISLVAFASLAAGPNCAWAGGLGPTIAAWSIEEADNDVGFGVKWEIDLGPRWDLEVRGAHLDGYTATIDGVDFALDIFPVDLGLAYNFNKDARVGPFVGFGVSYLLLDADATVAGEPASARVRDEFGFYGVAGVEVDLVANLALFAEAVYRQAKGAVQGDDLGSTFVDVAIDYSGPGAQVGLLLTW